jgi:ATP-dependent DNA helicase DinG
VLGEFGVKENYDTLEVETPFDWLNQAFLILPVGMPSPVQNREAYNAQVCNQIGRAIVLSKGRTLVLTTSNEMRDRAYEYVKTMLKVPYTLLCQGQAPNSLLAQQFREDVSSCLFGTDSFWTGIDIPGESLSCLIMDKLPFPHPNDPVLSYLDFRDGQEAFHKHAIPRAVRKFRQGFGRLIRSVNDYGVIVILDPRVKTEAYGSLFLNSVPKMYESTTIENIPRALEWAADKAAEREGVRTSVLLPPSGAAPVAQTQA